ncbi:MAG: AAA family ATPase [Magnetococcales bacterium]|nr:AAA family ATPase [Magnetococcales bacterium]
MITHLRLKNFTAFGDLKIDFSPRVNILIGENGTGKTHILKAAYGLCSGGQLFRNKPAVDKNGIEEALTSKLLHLFMPIDGKLEKIRRYGATGNAQLEARFTSDSASDSQITISLHSNSQRLAIQNDVHYSRYQFEPVFIPTKEAIATMKGFSSLYQKYGLSFDQTYQDICLLLDLPEVRPEMLREKSKWAIAEIEAICGGIFVFYGGGNVTFKAENAEYSANSIAEGFRKIGMLARLLKTGAIDPGVSGPLFWDEPESNMNPILMEILVQILLELSRNGQQIILATHDYILLKWFDLLMDKDKEDQVRFHSLHRDIVSQEIRIDSTDNYLNIVPNAISNTFNNLTKKHVLLKMGGLGK